MMNQNLRYTLWRRYWENPITKECKMNEYCYVCGRNLSFEEFEAGHIESGIGDSLDNFVPICGSCNRGMRQENLVEYKENHFPKINVRCFWAPERSSEFLKLKSAISNMPEIIEILSEIQMNNNLGSMIETIEFISKDYYDKNCKLKVIELSGWDIEAKEEACNNCEHSNSCKGYNCKYYYGENVIIREK